MRALNEQKFCGWCGSKVNYVSEWSSKCPSCGYHKYFNPKACTNIIVCKDNKILFIKRAQEPQKDKYDFPGGFIDMTDESAEYGAYRELKEEIGIEVSDLTPLEYIGSLPTPEYDWHDAAIRNMGLFFKTKLKDADTDITLDTKENSEYVWLEPKDYRKLDLAWDIDRKMIIKTFGLEA